TYVIEVGFYRDCGGVSEPSSIVIRCQSASAGFSLNIPAYKSTFPGNGSEVTRPCPSMPSQCNGGLNGGIRKWMYAGQITLPSRQSDWTFSYSVCCRNCAISTISTPCASNSALYVEATLNNLSTGDNQSPAFDQVPVAYVCLGQTYRYNHGIREMEGDSLSIELVTPMTGPGSTVNYLSGYSATQPLATSGTFELDPISGDITFTPQQIQTTVLAIRVKEYRNGICIGSVVRDMQVHVQGCNNNLPSLSGINGSTNYSIGACPGEQICFTIESGDNDLNQQLSLATDSGIAGAQYLVSGGSRPIMQFCWTPQAQDAGINPKRFNVTVYDDACPYNGSRTYSFLVFVGGPRYSIRETPIACKDGSDGALSVLSGTGNYSYLWSTGVTSQHISGLSSGTYTVTVSAGSGTCSTTRSYTLYNPTELTVQGQSTPASCSQSTDGSISLN
ncbi:MAG: SprB repeat-containing protein, partial [Bacteroidota bacterium]